MIQIFGTKKCKGTRAAQRFFGDRRVAVQFINLAEKGLSKGELASVSRALGGMLVLYDPARDVTERRVSPSEAQLHTLLVEKPACLKTPIVRDGAKAVLGRDPAGWKTLLDSAS